MIKSGLCLAETAGHIIYLHPRADVSTINASNSKIVKDKVGFFIPDVILCIRRSMIDCPTSDDVQCHIDSVYEDYAPPPGVSSHMESLP